MFQRPLVRALDALLPFVAGCAGVDTVGSVDDVPPAPRAKAPAAMWRALVAQEPRSFIVALSPTIAEASGWRYAGTATTATVTGLANGAAYSYRVCAVDTAGNLSAGATVSATPRADTLPAGTIAINAGAKFTRLLTVNLALGAPGATRPAQMCISAEPSCTSFVAYAAAVSYASVRARARARCGCGTATRRATPRRRRPRRSPCATDTAGNVSPGITKTATALAQ